MFDLPFDESSLNMGASVYVNGGVVAGVCHSPAGLVNIKVNGEYLVKGKIVCGLTNAEEEFTGNKDVLPFLLENRLMENGGEFVGVDPWGPNCQVSEHLVTGQNPASSTLVGQAVLALLNK